MSEVTNYLKLHKWTIPDDNKEIFDYKKSIADSYDTIDNYAEETNTRIETLEIEDIQNKENITELEEKHNKEIQALENLIPTRTSSWRKYNIK